MQDFIVLDTEGKACLRELAILDRHGDELYNVFVEEALDHADGWRAKPLRRVLEEFFTFARGKQVVCHHAEHDREVLQHACQQVGIAWEELDFVCTCKLTQAAYPAIKGYSLEYLCKHFDLYWDKRAYSKELAHTARYDTQFTYLLYRKLKSEQLKQQLHGKPNPFGDSRVDNPFEHHVDTPKVYEHEFSRFTTILEEIKRDPNHQSKGALVVGEAGNGKTHLMMRLAREVLKNNRLLFIRQPNHPETVIYHIYCRILESFMEQVPNSGHSQLEYLLAHSFSRIVLEHFKKSERRIKYEALLKQIEENHLSIYKAMGREGSDNYRANWRFIEKQTTEWWTNNYGSSNSGCGVIKGLIKFCSYTDQNKRLLVRKWLAGQEVDEDELKEIGLDNWQESMDREEFALQAIRVFSKLSIEDQPLIIVFDQLESLRDHENLLRSFGAALKQLFTEISNTLIIVTLFPDRWTHFQHFFDGSITDRVAQNQIYLNRPSERELVDILAARATSYQIDIEELFMPEELENIVKQNSIRAVLNAAADYYRLKADGVPLPVHARTFEERVLHELQKMRDEVDKLKRGQRLVIENDYEASKTADTQILQYLEQQKTLLAARYHNSIISDSDDLGKLLFLVKAWNQFKAFKIDYLHLSKRALPEHLMLIFPMQEGRSEVKRVVGFLQVEGSSFSSRLKNLNELVVSYPHILFAIFRDERQPDITGKVGKQEIERFRNYDSNRFTTLKKEQRLLFEALYKTVVDIQNRDYNADLQTVFESFFATNPEHWFSRFVT